jgi:hypothetical protein
MLIAIAVACRVRERFLGHMSSAPYWLYSLVFFIVVLRVTVEGSCVGKEGLLLCSRWELRKLFSCTVEAQKIVYFCSCVDAL